MKRVWMFPLLACALAVGQDAAELQSALRARYVGSQIWLGHNVRGSTANFSLEGNLIGDYLMTCPFRGRIDVEDIKLTPDEYESAANTLANWHFEPAVLDGKPVPVDIAVEMNFCLY